MHPAHVALTDSTTMGIGLIYTSLDLGPNDEVLTTNEDYLSRISRPGQNRTKAPFHRIAATSSGVRKYM
jgi:selenocysteine lyase/cysteine desulfurase